MTYPLNKSAMEYFEIKDCDYIAGTPDVDGNVLFFRVGDATWDGNARKGVGPAVERITLQNDVRGEYHNRIRACVWVNGKLFFECPYHALTAVGYVP